MKIKSILILVFLSLFLASPFTVFAQSEFESEVTYHLSEVLSVKDNGEVTVKVLEGSKKGEKLEFQQGTGSIKDEGSNLQVGERVYVQELKDLEGDPNYTFHDKYRLPVVLVVIAIFLLVVIIFAGIKGLSATAGLVFSILVLIGFVVPRILAGNDPLLISLIGIAVIGFISFYLAHGFNKKTTVALVSTFIALLIGGLLTILITHFAKLTGAYSEEALFLRNELGDINLKGILLSAIMFGVLGVLDDVTISQVASVLEIKRANPKLSFKELYSRGISIGKDHVASLVNTLVLAYVSASLPLLLFFAVNQGVSLELVLNEEFIAVEIFRSLIGGLAIILAVPISTILAAYAVSKWNWLEKEGSSKHNHTHVH
jgi:uncharacterized membrane protein